MSMPHEQAAHYFDSIDYTDVYEYVDSEGNNQISDCPEQPCPHCHNGGSDDNKQYLIPTPTN